VKLGRVVFEICQQTDRHTDRQTYRHTHCNTSHPYWGRINHPPASSFLGPL